MRMASAGMVLAFLVGDAVAGPDATANRFLSDTPSMMDWGSYRLEMYLKEKSQLGEPSVSYDWEKNRILITRSQLDQNVPETASSDCRDWFAQMRTLAYVGTETGKLWSEKQVSHFASFFRHNGFLRTIDGVTEMEALKQLDKMLTLQMEFWQVSQDGSITIALRCIGDLLSPRLAIEDSR